MSGVRVLVGTRKGGFILTSDGTRGRWNVSGPHFGGWEIYHITGSPADPNRLYASQSSGWFGQVIQRSNDGGQTWERAADGYGGWAVRAFAFGRDGRLYLAADRGLWARPRTAGAPAWPTNATGCRRLAATPVRGYGGARPTRWADPKSCIAGSRQLPRRGDPPRSHNNPVMPRGSSSPSPPPSCCRCCWSTPRRATPATGTSSLRPVW